MADVSRRRFLASTGIGASMVALGELACSANDATRRAARNEPALLTLAEASEAVRSQSLSPVALTESCLNRISRFDRKLNAFITLSANSALVAARQAEAEISAGHWRGPLHGIPIAFKDNIDTAGTRTTAGSRVFEQRMPAENAEVVQKLNAAGAIVLGKLNMHEFGLGTTSAISGFGAVRNPWNAAFSAGGSSGGCGAAVAARFCFGAVGTDTGGSIRVPASSCGIVGLKPTNDAVSTNGVVPLSRSFDQVGPMCRTVADTALLFRAMTSHPVAAQYDPKAPQGLKLPRVGIVKNTTLLCGFSVSAEVQEIFDRAVQTLRPLVERFLDVDLPMPAQLGALIDVDLWQFHAPLIAQSGTLYDARTRNEIARGKRVAPAGVDSLRKALDEHRLAMRDAFRLVDLVVLPTLPTLPISITEAKAPFSQDSCTFEFSLGGLPSLSIPCGMSGDGLPVGMQISGPPLSEPRLFALAAAYERVTKWHTLTPPL